MAFTVSDFEDLLRILNENPEWRERLRQAILPPEMVGMPNTLNQLTEMARDLLEAHRRGEERITQIEEAVARLVEAQRRTDETVAQLVEAQRRTDETVAQLVEAQRRIDETVAQLVEAQRRGEERLNQLSEIVGDLVQTMREVIRRLERLESWQVGESGRRSGERFERDTLARAPTLFFGGQGGGTGEPHIREKVGNWLRPLYRQGIEIPPHDDPLLADIIWWKGDVVAVVEVSIKVDMNDIKRVLARTRTLQQVGVNAMPVVIGEEWDTPNTEAFAQENGVEWYVRGGLSRGFLAFRQLSDGDEPTE